MNKHIVANFVTILCFCVLLTCCVMFPLSALATGNSPLLIYFANDYDSQSVGDSPYGMTIVKKTDYGITVVDAERTSGDGNKAAKIVCDGNADGTSCSYANYLMSYAPIANNFVLSFDINQANVNTGKVFRVKPNAFESHQTNYHQGYGTAGFWVTVGKDVRIKDTSIITNFQNGVWYKLDILFDLNTDVATLYVNGFYKGEASFSAGSEEIVNIAEIQVDGAKEGGDFMLDNFKLYLSDNVLTEKEFSNELAKMRASEFYHSEKYERGRLFRYDKFAYIATYNKTVGMLNAEKIWKDNRLYSISPVISDEGYIMAPVEDFAKLFGAKVKWNSEHNTITLTKGEKTLRVTADSKIYYIDGKPSVLGKQVRFENKVLYMSLNSLMKFLGVEYKENGDLIYFGDEISVDYDLGPMTVNADKNTLEEEVVEGIRHLLLYDRPSKEEIINIYEEKTVEKPYLGLLADDFKWINEGIEKDTEFKKFWNMAVANKVSQYLAEDIIDVNEETKAGGAAEHCEAFALAYRVTGNEEYKNRFWAQFEEIEEFGKLYVTQFLDVGTAAVDLGKSYAWMRDYLTEEQEERIREFIYENVLLAYEQSYMSSGYSAQTAFAQQGGNQSIIINCGGIACAIALMDSYPELCSELISCGIRSVERAFDGFGPDGAWVEGYSYWLYMAGYLAPLIDEVEYAFDTDFGLTNAPGLLKTINYAIAQKGSVGGYAVGDCTSQGFAHGLFMWHAKQTNNPDIAEFRKNNPTHYSEIDLFNWMFETDGYEGDINNIDGDSYQRITEDISLRTGWDLTDTSVLFHGGGNDDGHGHIDIGSFQFDMLGVRWATELPKEDYNSGIGAYSYRNGAEGHNVVVADISNDLPTGMVKTARGEITDKMFSDTISYGIMDLTQSNDIFSCGRRAVMLDKANDYIIVQDSYSAKENTDFWWFMHLENTIVEISEDGKTATLTKQDKYGSYQSITATIISEGNEKFIELEPKHLAFQGYDYDTTLPEGKELVENPGFKKLAVQSADTNKFKFTVVFRPADSESPLPAELPMERWKSLINLEGDE